MSALKRSQPGQAPRNALACVPMAVLLLIPTTAFSEELTFDIGTAYVHDSNFYRSSSDKEEADSMEVGGKITLQEQEDRLRYKASYTGSYVAYRKQDEANDPEHRVRLDGSYAINPLTTVSVKNNFRDLRNTRFSQEDIRDGDTGLVADNDRYQRNDLELLLHRDISRSWELDINATYGFVDFENKEERGDSDSDAIGVGGRVLYRFSPRHRFGGGLTWVDQSFDGSDTRLDADAEYLIADLAWVFDIGEQIQLIVNGGPTWIKTDQNTQSTVRQTQFVGESQRDQDFRANVNSCDFNEQTGTGIASRCDYNTPGAEPIPADNLGEFQDFPLQLTTPVESEDEVTFFGGASLVARFSDWTTDVDLRRKQSTTSGDSIAASLTRLRWEIGYAPPLATWNAYLAGSWERREAINDATIIDYTVFAGPEEAAQRGQAFTRVRDSSDRRDAFTALIGVKKQLSRKLSGDVQIRYRETEYKQSGQSSNSDTYFFVVGISYTFDTIRF
jgi:opacity protein-like surface antigen